LRNACPHQGGPLCRGKLSGLAVPGPPGQYRYLRRGEILRCPWHGWEFDVRTGQSYVDPLRSRVRTYPVELVPGPYAAETYPAAVGGDVVVAGVGRSEGTQPTRGGEQAGGEPPPRPGAAGRTHRRRRGGRWGCARRRRRGGVGGGRRARRRRSAPWRALLG